MPTPSEKKALAFVAIVVLLAGAARVLRAGALMPPAPTAGEQQGLARQTFAANSSATVHRTTKARGGPKQPRLARQRRDTVVNNVGGVASVPFVDARPGASSGPTVAPGRVPVDLDLATAPQIEVLPRIGPALARRIIASRDSLGPFGSLEGLRRVKGVGPATVRLLAPLVTFSGQVRR